MAKKILSEIVDPRSLRVLMVEDSEDDALLIIRELKKGGYNPVHERVENAATMKKALKEKQWDIILCDYKLPKFNAPSALAVLKETNIDIPIIIVSGTIGEETAAKCMRLGAHDYIMKNNLSRLCPAIVRELEEAASRSKLKQGEVALQESEEKYRNLVERANDGIGIAQDGILRYVNTKLVQMGGYSADELTGKPFTDFFAPEEVPKVLDRYKQRMAGKKVAPIYETALRHKNGSRIDVEVNAGIITYEGKPADLVLVRDITERKQAETALRESESRFRNIIENSNDGIIFFDGKTRKIILGNAAMAKLIGCTKEKLVGRSIPSLHPSKERANIEQEFQKHVSGELSVSTGIPVLRDDGSIFYADISSSFITLDGSAYFSAFFRDITDRKQAEAQKEAALEALRESEENFRRSMDDSSLGIRIVTAEGETLYANRALLDIYGYDSIGELKKTPLQKRYTPKSYAEFKIRKEKRERDELVPSEYEIDIVRKNGEIRHIHVFRKEVIWNNARQFQIIYQDITEKKNAEEALKMSEERMKSIFRAAPTGIGVLTDRTFMDVNLRMCEMTGYTKEELIGASARILYPTQADFDYVGTEKYWQIAQKGTGSVETRWKKTDGTIIDVLLSSTPIDPSDLSRGVTFTALDITERKRTVEELSKRSEELQTIIESSPIMIYFKDTKNRFLRVNKAVLEASGLAKEEIEGKTNEEINPMMAATLWEEDKEIIATGKPKIGILETIKTRRGSKVLQTDKVPYRDKEGNIIGIVGFSVDITEQNKTQEELLRSEEKYRGLIENSQEGIYQSTAEGRHLALNPAFARMLGYDSPEDVMQTITDIARQLYVNPEDRKKLIELVNEKGSIKDFETEFYKKDGSRVWVSINMHAVRDDEGRLLYYQGIDQDITEKKKIEAERQENIERLRKSLGATINAMAVTVETRDPYTAGHQRRVADLARAIAVEMNLTSEQIDGVRMASMIHDIGKISIPSEILTKPTQLTNLEFNLIKTHPVSGYNILKDIEFPWPIARIVQEHHERIDGSGYPNGLKGEQILLESKIIAVADVVEAISSHRPYRAAFGIDVGLDEITKNKGILYDPDVVDVCLRLFREKNYNLAA